MIANDALAETDDADVVEDAPHDEPALKDDRSFTTLRSAGQWLWNHLMLICIVVLLIGGIVVLAVYFAGRHP